jgi:hypothetical protein
LGKDQQANGQKQPDYEGPPIVLKGRLPDAITEETEDKKHEKKHRSLQTWFNGLLVIFTAITAAIGIWQGRLTHEAIGTAARQAKAAEDANALTKSGFEASERRANEAARAGIQQNKAAVQASIDQLHLDQRAWIGIQRADAKIDLSAPGVTNTVTAEAINTGKTPAIGVHVAREIVGVNNNTQRPIFTYSESVTNGAAELVPNGTMPIPIEFTFTDEEIKEFRAKTRIVYFAGTIWYEDVFARRHTTNFCMFIDQGFKSSASFSACSWHNTAD